MAVFTPVSETEAEPFIRRFGLGALQALTPIAEGVENTNYRLDTASGRFVLTLFEGRTDAASLPFCLGLGQHLAEAGLPTARPLMDADGVAIGTLNGRPAAILEWLPGAWKRESSLADQHAAGAMLARLHLAAADYGAARSNPVGAAARRALFDRCVDRAMGAMRADVAILTRLSPMIAEDADDRFGDLPRGPIHADYFPDNVLFEGDTVSGVIDLYFACIDTLTYDLAIALSAWGFDSEGVAMPQALAAFREGYESVRPLSEAEQSALPTLGAVAAMRFTLTRLHDRMYADPNALVTAKDPAVFLRRLDWWERVQFLPIAASTASSEASTVSNTSGRPSSPSS